MTSIRKAPPAPTAVRDMTGTVHAPFVLSPLQRAGLLNRLNHLGGKLVQAPDVKITKAEAAKRYGGLPFDVILTLEALRQLAEQGNRLAAAVYSSERIRLGIDRPTYHQG